MNKSFFILIGVFAALLQGCATLSESECREANWKIIGLEDGSAGRPVSYIGKHRQACADHGVKPDLDAYERGHGKGVQFFCTPRNGYQLGSKGVKHSDVCPADMRDEFRHAYADGLEVYKAHNALLDARSEQRSIHVELAEIADQIAVFESRLIGSTGTAQKRQSWLNNLNDLRDQQLQKEIELQDIDHQVADRESEYEYLKSRHRY